MISLKQSAEESAGYGRPGGEPYPYGMRLLLNDEVLEKMGYTQLPAAGTRVAITAYAVVVRTEAEPAADGEESERSACLQLTDIEISQAPSAAASLLYGN